MQCGTPAYQPPEQLKGESCGPGTDVYALGCIIMEVFGGIPTWAGMAPHTIILKVAGGNFPSTDHLENRIENIVKLCLTEANKRAVSADVLKAICLLYA